MRYRTAARPAFMAHRFNDGVTAGTLVKLTPDTPLYWQQARAASGVLKGLSRAVASAARGALRVD